MLPPFIPLPQFLLTGGYSVNAKLLYGLLLHRTMLSQRSGWVNEEGNVYAIYTVGQMAEDLNRSERTVNSALCELEREGLLTRTRQGFKKANLIFLQLPDDTQFSSGHDTQISSGHDAQLSSGHDTQILRTSNTDIEYKDKKNKKKERAQRSGIFRKWQDWGRRSGSSVKDLCSDYNEEDCL